MGRHLFGAAIQPDVYNGGISSHAQSSDAARVPSDSRREPAAVCSRCAILRSDDALGPYLPSSARVELALLACQQRWPADGRAAKSTRSTPAFAGGTAYLVAA